MKERLKHLGLFKDFTEDEMKTLDGCFAMKEYENGAIIAGIGVIVKELFIVVVGKVESMLQFPENVDRTLLIYLPGDFFGELSLFGNKANLANCVATEKTVIAALSEESISRLIDANPRTARKFLSRLLELSIQKLRNVNRSLSDLVEWGENASRRVITDELTGVYNRAFLDDAFENFFNISKSNNKSLSLFMIDIDNFREINESFGSDVGNAIILEIVRLMRSLISSHGIIARYGGDEFCVLLPEAGLSKSLEIAEHIRINASRLDFSRYFKDKKISVTLSIGVNSFPENAIDLESFKTGADEALYRAKTKGRNRVEQA